MPISTYLGNILLNLVYRNVAYTPPATVYVALYTVAPTAGGGGTEVTGNAYARTTVTFGAAASQQISNSATVTFPAATGSWGTPVAVGFFDAASGGNLLEFALIAVAQQQPVAGGQTYKFQVGALQILVS